MSYLEVVNINITNASIPDDRLSLIHYTQHHSMIIFSVYHVNFYSKLIHISIQIFLCFASS